MGGCMDHTPEGHGVSDLTMEPDVFVRREEPLEFRTNNTDDITEHRD